MYPSQHIIASVIFILMIFFLFPNVSLLNLFIILTSAVLIDVDHYLFYWIGKKDPSLRNAYHWFLERGEYFKKLSKERKKKYHVAIMPLHSLEFLIILILLSILHKIFFFIFIGSAFHIILDLIYELSVGKKAIYKVSLIYTLLNKRFIGF
jgi:hypothetical protein